MHLVLSFYKIYIPRLDGGQEGEDLGHERSKRHGACIKSNQDNDRNIPASHVLLVRNVLIHCQEYVKLRFGKRKQSAVYDAVPAHLISCSDFVAYQVATQGFGGAVVKKDSHRARRPSGSPSISLSKAC